MPSGMVGHAPPMPYFFPPMMHLGGPVDGSGPSGAGGYPQAMRYPTSGIMGAAGSVDGGGVYPAMMHGGVGTGPDVRGGMYPPMMYFPSPTGHAVLGGSAMNSGASTTVASESPVEVTTTTRPVSPSRVPALSAPPFFPAARRPVLTDLPALHHHAPTRAACYACTGLPLSLSVPPSLICARQFPLGVDGVACAVLTKELFLCLCARSTVCNAVRVCVLW
jgi:hypothetical protein